MRRAAPRSKGGICASSSNDGVSGTVPLEPRPAGAARLAAGPGARLAPRLPALPWSVLGPMLAIKAVVLLYGAIAFETLSNTKITTLHGLLEIWNRWDTPHYLDIATEGYTATGEDSVFIVFFPLFPWLTRAVSALFGDPLVAAFIVATLASIAAGLLLYRLARIDLPEPLARRATLLLFIFPTSYFLHVPYTEGLFIALVVGSFLAARSDRWALAGLLGAAASLTRINGLVLVPALAVEAYLQWRATRRLRWEWAWIATVGIGFGIYLLVNALTLGDPFAFLAVQREHWFKALTPPWSGIWETARSIVWREATESQLYGVQETTFIALGLGGTLASALVLRPSYTAWMGLNWLVFTSTSFIVSVPRYSITLFPLFLLFALASRRPAAYAAIGCWSLLFLALFIGQFVQGRWAF